MALLDNYPKLSEVTKKLDTFLREKHADFFGNKPVHLFTPVKPRKVIHDAIWGTFSFSWRELAVLDTPLLQRLRDIHQIGLAYQVYPSARHSRLEHSLGVLVMASRIFDSLSTKQRGILHTCVRAVYGKDADVSKRMDQLRDELRLAALLHDVGHSLHSHASEKVYGKLQILKQAAEELSDITGKRKGAGEVISFCFALVPCLREYLDRASKNLLVGLEGGGPDCADDVNLENVALLIVGRSQHPFLQFLGDIISSDIDADKLDYLLRDSTSAGLPLRYDVDMYLYSAQLELDVMADGEDALQKLYKTTGANPERQEAGGRCEFPFFDAYRLCLPKRAMHVLEQIVICKMMLFSYVYSHPKVRAAEGLLERMLDRHVEALKKKGSDEWEILEWFLEASDADLIRWTDNEEDPVFKATAYRLVNRLLPREVFRLSASETVGAPKCLLADFLTEIRDKQKGKERVLALEQAIGEELLKREAFQGLDWRAALAHAGLWLDVPKTPNFEDTQKVVSRAHAGRENATAMFPVHAWQHAYTSHRSYVRLFAYSEYCKTVKECAKVAMKKILRIEDETFYKGIERERN
jgi:HD superfamily phosphohydrolase